VHINKKVIRGINLSFCENERKKKSVFFLHGNSLSSKTFRFQFDDKRLNKYHLIALDLPGHGKSGIPENKDAIYSLTGLRDVVVDFINEHNIGDFIFAGHSLGGHIAIECLPYVSNCKGIIIWGTPPVKLPLEVSDLFFPHPDLGLFFQQHLSPKEIKRLSENTVSKDHAGDIVKIISQSDPEFRSILPISHSKGMISDEFEILSQSKILKAILHGKDDPFVKKDYLESLKLTNLYSEGIEYISDAGHSVQMDQPTVFNNFLIEFADQAFK